MRRWQSQANALSKAVLEATSPIQSAAPLASAPTTFMMTAAVCACLRAVIIPFLASSLLRPHGLCASGPRTVFSFLKPVALSHCGCGPNWPAEMAVYSLTENASSPFHAEPAHDQRVDASTPRSAKCLLGCYTSNSSSPTRAMFAPVPICRDSSEYPRGARHHRLRAWRPFHMGIILIGKSNVVWSSRQHLKGAYNRAREST